MSKHTPLPWTIPAQRDPQAVMIDAPMGDEDIGHIRWNGFIVCYGCDDDPGVGARKARANAEFVVRAATHHAKLVEALRECVALLEDYHDSIWHESGCGKNPGCTDAEPFRTLLAQLDGELE